MNDKKHIPSHLRYVTSLIKKNVTPHILVLKEVVQPGNGQQPKQTRAGLVFKRSPTMIYMINIVVCCSKWSIVRDLKLLQPCMYELCVHFNHESLPELHSSFTKRHITQDVF